MKRKKTIQGKKNAKKKMDNTEICRKHREQYRKRKMQKVTKSTERNFSKQKCKKET
jgi:hypothetical protein